MGDTLNLSVEEVRIPTAIEIKQLSTAYNPAVERVGNYLYALDSGIGKGYYGGVSPMIPAVGIFDIVLNEWRWIELKDEVLHRPFGGAKIFLFEDALIVFHNYSGNSKRTTVLSRLDLITEELSHYETSIHTPYFGFGLSGNYLEKCNRFVVFGGSSSIDAASSNDVHLLSMPWCRWIKPAVKGNPPTGREGHASCVHKGKIYYYGGMNIHSEYTPGLFLLTLGPNDVVSWSSVRAKGMEDLRMQKSAMLSFGGKLVCCGGNSYGEDLFSGLAIYHIEEQEFEKTDLPGETVNHLGSGAAAFVVQEGRVFGLFGGREKVDRYIRVSVDE